MIRFLHTADWQLGESFARFGRTAADRLRRARLETFSRALQTAEARKVDAFLVAGDLFESNWVEPSLVRDLIGRLGRHPGLPVFLLPGNHDPAIGPGSVWERMQKAGLPPHVTLLLAPGSFSLGNGGGALLLAAPLTAKNSSTDPSLELDRLAEAAPEGVIRVGITHGSPAIPGKHHPDDFPIAPAAASRGGLDYLAAGHWHGWQVLDGGRFLYPGTPEPEEFGQQGGYAALVEISGRRALPSVTQLPVGGLVWKPVEGDRASCLGELRSLAAEADRTVVQVTLTGSLAPSERLRALEELEGELGRFAASVIEDRSVTALAPAERAALLQRHPLLGSVLSATDGLEAYYGSPGSPLSPEARGLLGIGSAEGLDLHRLDAEEGRLGRELVRTAKELLWEKIAEQENES